MTVVHHAVCVDWTLDVIRETLTIEITDSDTRTFFFCSDMTETGYICIKEATSMWQIYIRHCVHRNICYCICYTFNNIWQASCAWHWIVRKRCQSDYHYYDYFDCYCYNNGMVGDVVSGGFTWLSRDRAWAPLHMKEREIRTCDIRACILLCDVWFSIDVDQPDVHIWDNLHVVPNNAHFRSYHLFHLYGDLRWWSYGIIIIYIW